MRTGRIYTVICKVNGKRYVGQTVKNVSERWKEHVYQSNRNPSSEFHRAINKYGVGMFNIRIIEDDILEEDLSNREIHWISEFDTFVNGYNQTSGGERNKNISPIVKDKISSSMTGVPKSDTHIEKIRVSMKGKKYGFLSDDCVNKGGKHLSRKIKAVHIQTGEEFIFENTIVAADKCNTTTGNISRGLKLGYRVGEYKFERIDDRPVKLDVIGKDKITGEIKWEFDSISKAGLYLSGGQSRGSGIRKSLKHPGRYTYKGCYWYYK